MAMTPPKKALDPMQESVKNVNQHTMGVKLARARAKKQGKKPIVEESESEEAEVSSDHEHADPKKSKYDKRNMSKIPNEDELVDLLRNGIGWIPTRFLDKVILKEMYLDDVKSMLEHMKVGRFYTVAYPTYKKSLANSWLHWKQLFTLPSMHSKDGGR
ncbi:hypothetical protein Rs2_35663 [Raphanus sativus]|nr:hypothetical protein Rs2_35663 [Raphanus sativus]